MKVILIRAARIRHEAGEIVEVSPAEAGYLFSTRSAVLLPERPAGVETPEGNMDAPETRTVRTARKGKK